MFSTDDVAAFCHQDCQNAYRTIYNFECYMRFMLRWELVAEHGSAWRQALGAAGEAAKDRLKQESEMRVIDTADARSILSYFLFSDLRALMVSEAAWPLFKREWQPLNNLEASLGVLGALRNKIAHFRRLTTRDLRVLERNVSSLAEMTHHYRRMRKTATRLEKSNADDVPTVFRQKIIEWRKATRKVGAPWASIEVWRVGRYIRIDGNLRSGAFALEAVPELLAGRMMDGFFLSIDHASGRLSLYVPARLDAASFEKLATKVMAFRVTDGFEGILTDEDSGEFIDFVFPMEVELPVFLKL